MASTRKLTTKDGQVFYEIRVSRGRGKSYLTTRWYPPKGWSKKAIERALAKETADWYGEQIRYELYAPSKDKKIIEMYQDVNAAKEVSLFLSP